MELGQRQQNPSVSLISISSRCLECNNHENGSHGYGRGFRNSHFGDFFSGKADFFKISISYGCSSLFSRGCCYCVYLLLWCCHASKTGLLFPSRVVFADGAAEELKDPNRQYILGAFPHGVFAIQHLLVMTDAVWDYHGSGHAHLLDR